MIRVLQIVDSMGQGGIQAYLMNIYRCIDKSELQFDFLVNRRFYNNYEKEIEQMGGRIYVIPSRRNGFFKNRKAVKRFFQEHLEYKAVHMHISSLTYIYPLVVAKKHGISTRIVHSHSTRASGNKIHTIIHRINKKKIKNVATDYYACSDISAEWFYGNSELINIARILPNGIDCNQYSFSETIREKYRRQFCWEGKKVIGHVGRFHYPKNHLYLIDIFEAFSRKEPDAILVLVGDGELRAQIEKKVEMLQLENKVVLLGNRTDVHNILQAFDVMVLPSHYEGFPVTLVEAQAAGLYCVVSDTITKTSDLADAITFCSILQSPDSWFEPINHVLSMSRNVHAIEKIREAGYDISNVSNELTEKYKLAYRG